MNFRIDAIWQGWFHLIRIYILNSMSDSISKRNRLTLGIIFGFMTVVQLPCVGQLTVVSRKSFEGKIQSIDDNSITVKSPAGSNVFVFTKPGKSSVPLPKAGVNLRHQTEFDVSGAIPASELVVGQSVKFTALLTRSGKCKNPIAEFTLISGNDSEAGVVASRKPKNTRDYVECEVTAKVASIRRQAMGLVLPKNDFAPTGKLRVRLADSAMLKISEKNLDRCRAGDNVKLLMAMKLDSGDRVAEKIVVELAREKPSANALTKRSSKNSTIKKDLFDPSNYVKFSDKPSVPRDVRSSHFLLHTDISDRSAKMLLDKLEYMIGLISRYYGRLPSGIIECYVVRDLSQWKDIPLEPNGVAKIQEGAGVTISRSLGKQKKSVVYSCDKHGVVQHEAVHAYCSQTFGSTGPTWYSEGMAEMGQYWKKGGLAVDVSPPVIRYLTNGTPKKMTDIVAAGQITGDSWQAYAWRWALCHLLAHNTNYSGRFKSLGLNMMSGGKATFESVYGDVAREISFEYDLFVKDFGNGYRVDLCQWDWTTKPVAISGQRRINCKIASQRGWQSSRLKLNKGKKYEFVCVGEWKISPSGPPATGAGDSQGKGKLIGVVFNNYQL